MPVAIYALSYKDTGSILSYCMMEKQTLLDQAAVLALRDRLVGPNLVLSLSTSSARFTIPSSDLVVDELAIPDKHTLADFTRAPYNYILDLTAPSTKLGDGKVKQLGIPRPVNSYVLTSSVTAPPNTFTVTLSNPLGPTLNFYTFVEGQSLVPGTLGSPNQSVAFPLATITQHQLYAIILVGVGVQPFVGFKQAQ